MKPVLRLAAAVALPAAAAPADAAIFDFSYTSGLSEASGFFVADDMPDADGFHRITAISGTHRRFSGADTGINAITLLAPGVFDRADNRIRATEVHVAEGIAFAAGATRYMLFGGVSSGSIFYSECIGLTLRCFNGTNAALSVVRRADGAVPEPATWAMMIAGFGAVGIGLRRRPRAIA